MRKCGRKKEGGGRTEGGDEMCIPEQGCVRAHVCVCVSLRTYPKIAGR